jgi:hypothetical protein
MPPAPPTILQPTNQRDSGEGRRGQVGGSNDPRSGYSDGPRRPVGGAGSKGRNARWEQESFSPPSLRSDVRPRTQTPPPSVPTPTGVDVGRRLVSNRRKRSLRCPQLPCVVNSAHSPDFLLLNKTGSAKDNRGIQAYGTTVVNCKRRVAHRFWPPGRCEKSFNCLVIDINCQVDKFPSGRLTVRCRGRC